MEWATQPADSQPAQWANRLGMVRRFAQYVSGSDPRTEIPPQELLPHRYHRKPPYLYSDKEVCRLIQTARQLPAADDLRAVSNATLFGLLAVTGMRVGEAIGLDCNDVDFGGGCSPCGRLNSTNHDWFQSTPPRRKNSGNMNGCETEAAPIPRAQASFFPSEARD